MALVLQASLLGLGRGGISSLLRGRPDTCDGCHWLLLAQLLEPRQPILCEALATIAAKEIFLALTWTLLG